MKFFFAVYELNMPLKVPFVTAKRNISAACDVLLEVKYAHEVGLGSAPPTLELTGEFTKGIVSFLQHVALPYLHEQKADLYLICEAAYRADFSEMFTTFARLREGLNRRCVYHWGAKACVEMALLDLCCKLAKVSFEEMLRRFFDGLQVSFSKSAVGGERSTPLMLSDVTISLATAAQMCEQFRTAFNQGFRYFKVKLSGESYLDLVRLQYLHAAAAELPFVPNSLPVCWRLDANEGFGADAFCAFLPQAQKLLGDALQLVEQPCPRDTPLADWQKVCSLGTDVFFDESVFSKHDLLRLCSQGVGQGFVLKIVKAGGVLQACEWMAICQEFRKKVMLSCMLESPVSVIAASAMGAACLQGNFFSPESLLFDLDAVHLLASTPFQVPFCVDFPSLVPKQSGPGLGVAFHGREIPSFQIEF